MNKSTTIILQARMGSTRLPGKMQRSFYNGKSLLRVILERLTAHFDSESIVVATSQKEDDNSIAAMAEKSGVQLFRGSETDVLERFVLAGEQFGSDYIIRICADNPFIQTKWIKYLIGYNSDSEVDYVGFRINRTLPAIKSHLGFFPERVTLKALREVYETITELSFREHVTNFFYSEQNNTFKTSWIDLDYPEDMVRNVRLTIDSRSDFETANRLYRFLNENGMEGSEEQIFDYLKNNPDILKTMNKNIRANEE